MIAVFLALLLCNLMSTLTLKDRQCTQQTIYKSIQMYCSGVPDKDEWEKMNNATTYVFITCAKPNNGINITLENNRLRNMKKITFFYIKNCKLINFPKEYFENLFHLENVVFDNIPLQRLQSNVFKNSSNLIQLTFLRLYNLQTISARFMAQQNKLTKLHIIECNVSTDQMKPVLISVYITLTDLYWRKNKQKLYFHKTYFRDFIFDNLILENNEIDNTDFLNYVRTKSLSLKYNPISLFGKFLFPMIKGLESLNLAFTGLSGVFPEEDRILKLLSLKEMILSDNRIEALPKMIYTMFPGLKILDLRNNRMTTLPSTLHHMLTMNLGRILHSSNMFHCNCEMRWIALSQPKLSKQVMCRTITLTNGTMLSNKTISKTNLDFICLEPELQLELYEQFKDRQYSVTIEDKNVKTYTIALEKQAAINLRCEGRGDPAPKLKWISEGQTLKVTKPSHRKYETYTIMNNLVVEATKASLTFICKGTNILGSSSVKLKVLLEVKPDLQPAKIVSIGKNYGNSFYLSTPLILSVMCFFCFHLF